MRSVRGLPPTSDLCAHAHRPLHAHMHNIHMHPCTTYIMYIVAFACGCRAAGIDATAPNATARVLHAYRNLSVIDNSAMYKKLKTHGGREIKRETSTTKAERTKTTSRDPQTRVPPPHLADTCTHAVKQKSVPKASATTKARPNSSSPPCWPDSKSNRNNGANAETALLWEAVRNTGSPPELTSFRIVRTCEQGASKSDLSDNISRHLGRCVRALAPI